MVKLVKDKETHVKMINMAQLNEAQPITESKASLSETKVNSEERKSEMLNGMK